MLLLVIRIYCAYKGPHGGEYQSTQFPAYLAQTPPGHIVGYEALSRGVFDKETRRKPVAFRLAFKSNGAPHPPHVSRWSITEGRRATVNFIPSCF